MTGKDHAAWDRLAERFRYLAVAGEDVTVPGRAPTMAALTAERVGLVEAGAVEGVAVEYAARVTHWCPPGLVTERSRTQMVAIAIVGFTVVMAAGLLILVSWTSPLVMMPSLMVWAPLMVLTWQRLMQRSRVTRRAAARACPDCGFDLTGVPPGLDPGAVGVEVGPRRCPECGSLWPLVPPPVPAPPGRGSAEPKRSEAGIPGAE